MPMTVESIAIYLACIKIGAVAVTIADSLGAPFALPYSFELCRRYVDDVVLITDEAMRDAMGLLFFTKKLKVLLKLTKLIKSSSKISQFQYLLAL